MAKSNDTEFDRLCDAAIDGSASVDDIQMMERLALQSPERMSRFALTATIHAGLCQMGMETFEIEDSPKTPPANFTFRKPVIVLVSLAACLMVGLALWSLWLPAESEATFAVIKKANGCLWEKSTVPIRLDQRLGRAELWLAKGMVGIEFDSGAIVEIHGPAQLELMNSNQCRLTSGTLVATVNGDLKGFTVLTPNGKLIDQGTSFGVSIDAQGESVVEVFSGKVDVEHPRTGKVERLVEKEILFLSRDKLRRDNQSGSAGDTPHKVLQISCADGLGRDHWIQRTPEERSGSDDLLLVKNCWPDFKDFDRRIHLAFDTSKLEGVDIVDASLQLTATPSGLGYPSRSPDTVIAVYGITDETLDNWSVDDLDWKDSPGVVGKEIQPSATCLLGRFTIKNWQLADSFQIRGQELVQFLKADTNGVVSMILVSETEQYTWSSVVHAFASSRHAELPPPTLRIWFGDQPLLREATKRDVSAQSRDVSHANPIR